MLSQQISTVFRTTDLVHISWNPFGTELMIADEAGKIALCAIFVALNRITILRVMSPDPDDGLRSIVGLSWLPQIRRVREQYDMLEPLTEAE